jgi:cytochrome c556
LGVETRALPDIWLHREEFDEGVSQFVQQSGRLVTVLSEPDIANAADQVKATADTCKACHDRFRDPED